MQELLLNLGYQFKNMDILRMALTHKSCGSLNNEKMEFLGDSILNNVAAELIFMEFPSLSEGSMSRIRAGLVCAENLLKLAKRIGVEKHLKFVRGVYITDANPSMLADAMEAIFAAIYLDGGHEEVRAVILRHLMISLQKGEATLVKDPKTALQEHLQGRGLPTPTYTVTRELSQSPIRFEVSCEIPKMNIKALGKGQTRKLAESNAASIAMQACRKEMTSCHN
jgi:ribonuclease-3